MKRRDLERKLRMAGCYLKREGSSHALWINPKTGVAEAVPKHAEVKELTVEDFDKHGHAELRFKDKDSIIHYSLYMGPSFCASSRTPLSRTT